MTQLDQHQRFRAFVKQAVPKPEPAHNLRYPTTILDSLNEDLARVGRHCRAIPVAASFTQLISGYFTSRS